MGKVLMYLPDGIGLRNFAFGKFTDEGKSRGHFLQWWNETGFPVGDLTQTDEFPFTQCPMNKFTLLFNRARNRSELNWFGEMEKDPVYSSYLFPLSYKLFLPALKSLAVLGLSKIYRHKSGINRLREKMKSSERNTKRFRLALENLRSISPELLFFTNQRTSLGIAPLEAARELGIPTVCFIFSWDNLPKATLVLNADYFFVWSHFMKSEILKYYPEIDPERVKVVGTPQFEQHKNPKYHWTREKFCNLFGLNTEFKFCCFSGDDITTSPQDPLYLRDLAKTVQRRREQGDNWHIIFRPCPVDQSGRYDKILDEYKAFITVINPSWKSLGDQWNEIYPTPEDHYLLINIGRHSEIVFNIGSSMIFDFGILNKPCCYLNYTPDGLNSSSWTPEKIYNFVHFRSMPNKDAVFWARSYNDLNKILQASDIERQHTLNNAQEWFAKIVQPPPEKSSEFIWNEIDEIINA